MNRNYAAELFKIWAHDNQVYGPVDLPVLIEWVKESRVFRETWIHLESKDEWRHAKNIPPLHEHFPPGDETDFLQRQPAHPGGVMPEELRQAQILASMSNQGLAQLIRYGELRQVPAGDVILHKDEPGDSLYFVLSGSVRARLMVGMEEKVLTRIEAGELFGEMAMFTQRPRSADVVADTESRLLRFGAEGFRQLIAENPEAAAPMLYGIAGMMAHRIWEDNQRLQQEVASEFVWR
jgi:hypothetical protein